MTYGNRTHILRVTFESPEPLDERHSGDRGSRTLVVCTTTRVPNGHRDHPDRGLQRALTCTLGMRGSESPSARRPLRGARRTSALLFSCQSIQWTGRDSSPLLRFAGPVFSRLNYQPIARCGHGSWLPVDFSTPTVSRQTVPSTPCFRRGEIRTHVQVSPVPVFRTGALDLSATLLCSHRPITLDFTTWSATCMAAQAYGFRIALKP